jgi:hypothetical protein
MNSDRARRERPNCRQKVVSPGGLRDLRLTWLRRRRQDLAGELADADPRRKNSLHDAIDAIDRAIARLQ